MITDSYRTVARSWLPGHAHRPQQPELPGALEDRERQGVGDAEEGDDHGQGEQGVDEVQEHVDVGAGGLPELVPVLHLGQRVAVGDRLDGGAAGLEVDAVGEGDGDLDVELRRRRWPRRRRGR